MITTEAQNRTEFFLLHDIIISVSLWWIKSGFSLQRCVNFGNLHTYETKITHLCCFLHTFFHF